MPALRIPIVGSYTNREFSPVQTKDQQFVNCYPEIVENPATGKKTVYLYKRVGSSKGSALGSASTASNAMVSWSGSSTTNMPVVAGFIDGVGTSTSIWNLQTSVQIGSSIPATNQVDCLTETNLSDGSAYLVGYFVDSSTGVTEQWFFQEGGAWTQVTDADFPNNVVGCPVHMDGYVFNLTQDGKIYNSDLNSVSTYTATNFITAGQYPDRGVSLGRLGAQIVAFGEKSIERFYNAGNPVGSPLSRVQDGGLTMGAARRVNHNQYTVLQAFGSIYWLGTSGDGAATGIYRFKGNEPEKISNAAIDKWVASGAVFGFIGTAVLHGMRHVLIRLSGIGIYAFCLDTGFWWKLTLASGEPTVMLAVDTLNTPQANSYFIGSSNARANVFNDDLGQDDSVPFTMTVQTTNLDLDTRRKKIWDAVTVIGDVQIFNAQLNISFSDDDFTTFSASRSINLSTQNTRLTRWGASRRRAWKITNSTATRLRLEALEFEYHLGSP